MDAELEVQRTIKGAELTAFLCFLKKVIGAIKVHVDNKGIIDGLWRGERKCIDPKAGDAELWVKIWEELHVLMSRGILEEVEHVKAHRTKKDKKEMSHFENFVTDGNEKADKLAKAGAMLDEGLMAKSTAKTVQQEREREKKKCLQPWSTQPAFTAWWKNGKIVKSSSRNQKKSGFSRIRKRRKRNIERSRVLMPTSIDVRDVEEAVRT